MAFRNLDMKKELNIPKRKLELKSEFDLPRLKTYISELFWLEIHFLMRQSDLIENEDIFSYVIFRGNSGWRYPRDVIDVVEQSHLFREKYLHYNVITLSQNGLFQSLPEAMFHPLTLGHAYSTVGDIVDEIKSNTIVTEQCRQIFTLFDTAMFEYKTEALEREMTWPYLQDYSPKEKIKTKPTGKSIIRLVQEFFQHDLQHTYHQALILLSTIVYHEHLKCSLDLQAQLLTILLSKKVEVKEIPHFYENPPYERLGANVLGIDSGLTGSGCQAELDDLLIKIWLDSAQEVDEYVADKKKQEYILGIMDLFDITSRDIHFEFQINDSATDRILGHDGYLGVNITI